MTTEASPAVRLEVADHIATVTIDYPPVNAFGLSVRDGLTQVFAEINQRALAGAEIRAVILTGAGERAFCAGADLKARTSGAPVEDYHLYSRRVRDCFWAIYDCAVPVIGAINGPALGGGLAVAAVCDILIASERATFGCPEINVGLLGGGKHLTRLVPQLRMRRMYFTGERIDGHEGYRLGFVDRVVPPDQLMDAARDLAAELAAKSPIALRLAKEALNRVEFMDLKEGYRTEQDYTAKLNNYEDSREAMRAFVEKRAPVFTGR
ncbi:MAG: enoyl-CoA hydratase/isomerase family protein [Chloroflexi bacterium]|nr:enoyl-CoA hydratase/isomerase family protein [Chloroflexota bacterium]